MDVNLFDLVKKVMKATESNLSEINEALSTQKSNVNCVDQAGRTILMIACSEGNYELAKLILKYDGDPSLSSMTGYTPLHSACSGGYRTIIELLLSKGVNINAQDQWGNTPLHEALTHPEVVTLLLSAGANCNLQNQAGDTPLHCACYYGEKESTARLIDNGALLDIQNKDDRTPLHMACLSGLCPIASLLLISGADPNIENRGGLTPLILAKRCRNSLCAQFIGGYMHYHKYRKPWLLYLYRTRDICHNISTEKHYPQLAVTYSSDLVRFVTEFM